MAIIKNILKVDKKNGSTTQTALDYSFCENGLSIWTYAANDTEREGGTKQNILFELKEVRELQKIINEYLNLLGREQVQ